MNIGENSSSGNVHYDERNLSLRAVRRCPKASFFSSIAGMALVVTDNVLFY